MHWSSEEERLLYACVRELLIIMYCAWKTGGTRQLIFGAFNDTSHSSLFASTDYVAGQYGQTLQKCSSTPLLMCHYKHLFQEGQDWRLYEDAEYVPNCQCIEDLS